MRKFDQSPQIFIVIPCHNEEEHIQRVLENLPDDLAKVFVVDDASTDATKIKIEEFFASLEQTKRGRFIYLSHQKNRGVGAAIATGYASALLEPGHPFDAFCVMAGDGQMALHDLTAVTSPILRGQVDYMKGNRFDHESISEVMPWSRRLGGEVFSAWTSLALGKRIRDSQCGYTALSRSMCQRLNLGCFWPRYGYPNDLLVQLNRLGARIAETPVEPIYGPKTSQMKLSDVTRIAKLLTRLVWQERLARLF